MTFIPIEERKRVTLCKYNDERRNAQKPAGYCSAAIFAIYSSAAIASFRF